MLLETLIAMVIVMTCFGVGISIYANVTNADNTRLRLRASLLLQQLAAETERDKSFISTTSEAEPLRIVKIISPWNANPAVQQLQLEAWDADGNKIAELTELIAAK